MKVDDYDGNNEDNDDLYVYRDDGYRIIFWNIRQFILVTTASHHRRRNLHRPRRINLNPLNAELNPICYLLALLAHHFLHVSRIRVKSLTLRLLIPPGAWIFVCCECRVLSGRGLCDELITRREESYQLWCVVVCDLETSRLGAPYIYMTLVA